MRRLIDVATRAEAPARALRVVIVGLGPIGRGVADECARRGPGRVEVVGAVDRDPAMAGKTLGEIWGPGRADGAIRAVAGAEGLDVPADVALVTTTSRLETLEPQLGPLFARGLAVVSSSEELFYPDLTDPVRAGRIDAAARAHGVGVVGSGINPGFLLDVLPTVLAIASGPPVEVHCERYVDLAQRRPPLQAKAGLGMEVAAFRELAAASRIGHVGLVESAAYLAGQLGMEITTIEESLEPVAADRPFDWQGREYPAGRVVGFEHRARAWGPGRSAEGAPVRLFLRMAYRQDDPRDRIVIRGTPVVDAVIRPCVAGDSATAAVMVHLAARIRSAAPGLRLVHELGLRPEGPPRKVVRA